jgi:hypothetical protein
MQSPSNKAQAALAHLEEAVVEILRLNPEGMTNAEIARQLGIETGETGEHRNMLSWSIVGRLIHSGKVERVSRGRKRLIRLI